MSPRGIRIRLALFLVMSALGVVYVSGNYLGLVDRVLGRGFTVQARLPDTGGLYTGSEVTYRGVRVGEVASMRPTRRGVDVTLALEQGVEVPAHSPVFVHNGSAVGEQYLDFVPEDRSGPFLGQGDVVKAGTKSLPTSEERLLLDLDTFVGSVDRRNLQTVVGELGTMFRDTGRPLQRMVDGGSRFVRQARANQAATIDLIEQSRTVLRKQQGQSSNIRAFARDLAGVTDTLRRSDTDLRETVQGGQGAARQVDALLRGVEPTMPVLLSNLVTVNQVVTTRLPAVEQLLVTYPRIISSGFTGTPGDGYGHVQLQFDGDPAACRKGYLPPDKWRPSTDLTDTRPYYAAHCASGPPYNMRGTKYAPYFGSGGARNRVAPYDPETGRVTGGGSGQGLTVGGQGGEQALFGEDSWKWMLIGPMEQR
jgi:phospholipid/cholesterol/gamma-HCH transport system substrate-binding protein